MHSQGLWGEIGLFPFFTFRLKKKKVSNLLATSLPAWLFLRGVNRKQNPAKSVKKVQACSDRARNQGRLAGPRELGRAGCRPVTAKQKRPPSSGLLSCLVYSSAVSKMLQSNVKGLSVRALKETQNTHTHTHTHTHTPRTECCRA